MKINFDGDYEITAVNFGFFRLDGGSMFGSVPKNIWNKTFPCDEENRILLAERSLVLKNKDKDKVILIDVGMGDKWSDKFKKIYAIEQNTAVIDEDSVTDIILTHLHFDHAGGISKLNEKQEIVPAFPNAKIHVQKSNLANAKNPTRKEQASYMKDNYSIAETKECHLIEGSKEIFKDIFVHVINGHTKGQQWIEIRGTVKSDGTQDIIVFPSDMMPTTRHIHPAYHLGYDTCAETLIREKEDFLNYIVEKNARVLFQHDPDVVIGRVIKDEKGGWRLES